MSIKPQFRIGFVQACSIFLIDKYIDSNLRFAPIVKKEQWQQMKKKIDKQCKSENNDAEDPFNNVGYVGLY